MIMFPSFSKVLKFLIFQGNELFSLLFSPLDPKGVTIFLVKFKQYFGSFLRTNILFRHIQSIHLWRGYKFFFLPESGFVYYDVVGDDVIQRNMEKW